MSRTILHKQKGRWKNGFQETTPWKLRLFFYRRNSEKSYFTERKLWIKENDLDNDMQNELTQYNDYANTKIS